MNKDFMKALYKKYPLKDVNFKYIRIVYGAVYNYIIDYNDNYVYKIIKQKDNDLWHIISYENNIKMNDFYLYSNEIIKFLNWCWINNKKIIELSSTYKEYDLLNILKDLWESE